MKIEHIQVKDLPDLRDRVASYPEDLIVLLFENFNKQKISESVPWPLNSYFNWTEYSRHDFFRRVLNIQQVGNEDLSPARMWDSLKRAAERVEEQAEGMSKVKSQYEALRSEWEAEEDRLEQQRALQIKIKRLQAEKDHLTGKAVDLEKIKERLQLLRENPDYPELRTMREKMNRLEQTKLESEAELAAYSQDPNIDWDMVEKLKEDSLAWAELKSEADMHLCEIEELQQNINALSDHLKDSGYYHTPAEEYDQLVRAEAELAAFQRELEEEREASSHRNNLFENMEKSLYEEKQKLKDYALIANTTGKDKRRLAGIEKQLKIGRLLFPGLYPGRRMKEKQQALCQKYKVADYNDFIRLEKEYENQRQTVNAIQMQLKTMRRETEKERSLVSNIALVSQKLRLAYASVNASGLDAWRSGWEEHIRQMKQLSEQEAVLEDKISLFDQEKIKLLQSDSMLREKLTCLTSSGTNRDELITIIQNISIHLRLKDVAAKQCADIINAYNLILNKRNMEHLAAALEPLDDLEREARLSDTERNAAVLKTKQKIDEASREMQQAAADLKKSRSIPIDPDLEKKLETVKQQWQTFLELQHALADTKELLESCLEKWQLEYGIALKIKAKQILNQAFSLPLSDKKEVIMAEAAKYYFAYRQALIELALEDDVEKPLFFFVDQQNEPTEFWDGILRYYQELSPARKVIFGTTNSNLWQYIKVNYSNRD